MDANNDMLIDNNYGRSVIVSFPYNPVYIHKIKEIAGHRWDPVKKC